MATLHRRPKQAAADKEDRFEEAEGVQVTLIAATIGRYFYVLAGGNAANFLHGASVEAFIFLVQAEILAAAARCTAGDVEPGYHEVSEADRRRIAQIWLAHFNRPGAHRWSVSRRSAPPSPLTCAATPTRPTGSPR